MSNGFDDFTTIYRIWPEHKDINPPLTHCFRQNGLTLFNESMLCQVAPSNGSFVNCEPFELWKPVKLCGSSDQCRLPVQRLCGLDESPLDLLHTSIVPGLGLLLLVGLFACWFLQWLSDYYNMFRVFGTVHRSLVCEVASTNNVKRYCCVDILKENNFLHV